MNPVQEEQRNSPTIVAAQEVACFAYCPEQWRLQYGLKVQPTNQKEMRAGTRHHERMAAVERVAEPAIGLGWRLMALALAMLLGLWVLGR